MVEDLGRHAGVEIEMTWECGCANLDERMKCWRLYLMSVRGDLVLKGFLYVGDAAGGRASRHRKPANAWWLPGGAPAPEQQNEAGSPSPQAASKSPTQSAAGSPAAPKAAKQVPVPVHAQVEPPEAVAMEIAEPGPAAPAVDSGEAAPEPVPAKAEKKRNRAKAAKGGPQPADEVDAEPAAKVP